MKTSAAPTSKHNVRSAGWRSVVAAGFGNVLEWYDVIIYAYMAPVISVLFFPSGNPAVALISTYAGLVVSYLIRPIGAMVMGSFSDRHGRKAALTVTITLMTLGVGMLAVTPTYASIGVVAPILLMVSRLVQGFSAGGEFGAATTFMAESGRTGRRFRASWQAATQGMAMVLAGTAGWLLFTLAGEQTTHAWAWRIPFVFGILIGPVGLWIRNRIPDTVEFRSIDPVEHPLRTTFRDHWGRVVVGMLCVGTAGMSVYLITFLGAYAIRLDLAAWSAYAGAAAAGVMVAVLAPVFGRLADRVGTVPVILTSAAVGFVAIYPLLTLVINLRSAGVLIAVEALLGVVIAAYFGALSGFLVDLFETRVRTTGIALSYNIGMTVMGSGGLLILTAWTQYTLYAPAFYFMIVAPVSIIGALFSRRYL